MSTVRKRILMVVHDSDMRFMLDKFLNEAGYSVEACSAGLGIVESRHAWPDLFILEKDLPTIDGIVISKFLGILPETKRTPIIMLSAYKIEAVARRTGLPRPAVICGLTSLDFLKRSLMAIYIKCDTAVIVLLQAM